MSNTSKSTIAFLLVVLLLVAATACGQAAAAGTRAADGTDNQAQLAQQAQITQDQAQAAALAKVPGTVQRTRLQYDNGTLVYDVTVAPHGGGATSDIEVDAAAGNVLKTEAVGQSADDDGGDDD